MRRPKISIIIPVYNGSHYIDRCLNSILLQKLEEFEIIIINDGSTDNSLEILSKYNIDHRVKILTQKNKGASYSRNFGIEKATGEYIAFIDIDDYISSDMYYKMYKSAIDNNSDIVCCSFIEKIGDINNRFEDLLMGSNLLIGYEIKDVYLNNITKDIHISGLALWNKIFKKSFLEKYILRIREDKVLGEDREFISRALMKADIISNVNEPLYFYTKENENSITSEISINKVRQYLLERKEISDFINSNIKSQKKISEFFVINNKKIYYKLIDYCIKQISSNNNIFNSYKSIKVILELDEMKNVVNSELEVSNFSKLFNWIYKMKCYLVCYMLLIIKSKIIKNEGCLKL